MRTAALLAVSTLVAACSQSVGGEAEMPQPSGPPAATPPSVTTPATDGPAASAPISEVIEWIEAGTPVDLAAYHVAFRDGVTTRLGDDIAFVAPSGVAHSPTQCITDAALSDGALTCLVDLTNPAPQPDQAEGVWKPGWTEFSGTALSVGSLRGDPGPFTNGTGTELAAGRSLAFGDNRCRSDDSGLYCVNYAHRSAARIAADGIVPFGCLAEVTPPPESAARFSC